MQADEDWSIRYDQSVFEVTNISMFTVTSFPVYSVHFKVL